MTWSAVGTTQGVNTGGLGLSNQGIGNLIIAEVINFSDATNFANGLSGGGVTWVAAGTRFLGANNAFTAAVFLGTVTATGAGTAVPTWSGGTAPASYGIASHEFHSTVGSWTFITQGSIDSAAGTNNWASLSANAGDLYWGYAADHTTAAAGSTSGYTYDASADGVGNGMAFNVNCAGGATFPAWTDGGQGLGIMVLVREGGAAAPPDGPMGNQPLGWPAPLTSRFGPNQPFEAGGFSIDAPPALTVNAGVATASAVANNPPFKPYVAGLGGSGYNSWFVDQNGSPRLMVIEQGWALPFNAGRWNSGNWQGDFTSYFSTRASQGYTAWYGVAWGSTHVDSTALSGRSYDGVYALKMNGTPGNPVTGTETLTLNAPFWDRIDAMFATARQYGIACFLNMGLSYDVADVGAIWHNASTTQASAFGAALVARFPKSSYPHVHWFFGDDDDGPNDTFWSAILSGMQGAGDTRTLISIEQFTNTNCHIEFDNGTSFSGAFGAPNATYNWAYCYDAAYFGLERSYTEGGTFTHIPAVYGDGFYYGDIAIGSVGDRMVRTAAWWALSSGSRGFAATSGPSFGDSDAVWMWSAAGAGRLTSDPNGSWCTTAVKRVADFVSGLPDWNKLIPDTGNVFITAGRGTRGTCDVPGGTLNQRIGNNYVAGSITPTGTLAIIYCKSAMSITIDQTKMNAGYTATWVDPSNPTLTQSATTGSTYSSSGLGNNAAGDPDWVLVLQAPAAVSATAGVAAASATAVSPAAAIASSPGVAASTAVASAPSVAATAAGGVATGSAASLSAQTAHTATSGVATGPATALGPSSALTATSGVATSSAVSASPTVNTSGSANAPAGAAASVASAVAPSTAVTLAGGVAQSGAVAASPSVASTAAPGAGGGSALAAQPSIALQVHAGVAQSTASALNPTAQATGSTQAGAANALAVAAAPSTAVTVHAGVAQSSALANPATANTSAATNANAGVAAATASAMTVHVSSAAQPPAATGPGTALTPVPAAGGLAGAAQSAGSGTPAVVGRFAQVASSSALALRPVIAVTITAGAATASAVSSGGHVPKQIVPGTVSVPVVKVATAIAGIAGRATATGRSSDA